jgi:hypothetical protein
MTKYSNIYDMYGNLINKAPQHNYTIKETEALVDRLSKEVKEYPDDNLRKVYLNNAVKWLMYLYQTQGNPHEKDLIEAIKNASTKDVSEEEITTALNAIKDELKTDEDGIISGDTDQ